jgi:methyltransferase (TIGR00027 family)
VPADYGDPIADQRLHDDVAGELVYLDTPFTAYLAARTRFFDLAVVDAIAAGIGQVVVVGAGYDGRSLRYSAAQVQWFELDHPATVADRSARLGRLGLTSTAVAVPAEFSVDDVGARLAAAGHDAGRASQLICEGVTPYLDRDVVVRLLRALRARAAAGSRLAIDFALVPEGWRARRSRARLRARVAAHGEPFRFEVPAAGLGALMRESGWHVQSVTQPTALVLAAPYP